MIGNHLEHADDPVPRVAAALGRSVPAIYGMRERLARQGRIRRRQEPFTEADLALLTDPTLTNVEVAQRTGRSREVIAQSRWTRGMHGPQRTPRQR
jgi:hypothetical protein